MRDVPFLLRAFQWQFIEERLQAAIEKDRSLLTDKTREMGVTWMVMAVQLWGWLFQTRFSALNGSITEDKIDSKNNINTLFWKFDYLLESLKISAPFLYPHEYNEKKHRQHMKRFNPQTNSMLLGEVMGPNFGRSGRVKMIFLDEFAEAPYPASTWASSSRTSNCRIVVFTPKGMNFAGRLANPGHGKPRTIDKVTLHWMVDESKNKFIIRSSTNNSILARGHGFPSPEIFETHPEAMSPQYPWYERAKRELNFDPILIAQELDVNYNESVEGQIYPQIERARYGEFEYDPVLKLYCAMDYGLSDMTALIWFQFSPYDNRFKVIDSYQARGKTIKWFVPFFLGPYYMGAGQSEGGYTEADQEVIERHAAFMGRYTAFYGDPAGKQRNMVTATSVIQVLGEYGIYVQTNEKTKPFAPRKEAVSAALPYCDFNERYCADLIQALRDSRQRENGTPVHGPESHYRSAFEYGFANQPHGVAGKDGDMLFGDDMDFDFSLLNTNGDRMRTDNPFLALQEKKKMMTKAEEFFERMGRGETQGSMRRSRGGWGRRR